MDSYVSISFVQGTARGFDHQSRDGLPTRDAGSLLSQQKNAWCLDRIDVLECMIASSQFTD
jgi:hypothetical protein